MGAEVSRFVRDNLCSCIPFGKKQKTIVVPVQEAKSTSKPATEREKVANDLKELDIDECVPTEIDIGQTEAIAKPHIMSLSPPECATTIVIGTRQTHSKSIESFLNNGTSYLLGSWSRFELHCAERPKYRPEVKTYGGIKNMADFNVGVKESSVHGPSRPLYRPQEERDAIFRQRIREGLSSSVNKAGNHYPVLYYGDVRAGNMGNPHLTTVRNGRGEKEKEALEKWTERQMEKDKEKKD